MVIMSELTVCMICLRSDRLLRSIETILFNFHDELCDYALPPTYKAQYCAECIWLLRKFHIFKIKCIKANKTLQMGHKMNMPNIKSFLKEQITPPSLSRSNGNRCKAFVFVYDDKNNGENITNTPKTMLKPNNATNSSNYTRVKKFTTCNISNSRSSINMNKDGTLLNPTVNLSLNNVINSSHTVSETTIDKTKQMAIAENEVVIKHVNNVTPLIKTADKEEVLVIENVDPLMGLDVLDKIKQDSDDDDDDTLCGSDDDNKDDMEFLDDDFVDNIAQDTVKKNNTADVNQQIVSSSYTDDKSCVKDITYDVYQKIESSSYTKGLLKIENKPTDHTQIDHSYATDSSVPISNKSSVNNTASNVNNDVTSNVRNNAPPCKVSYTPYEINVTGTHSTNAVDNAVPEPSNEVTIYCVPSRKWDSDNLRNSEVKKLIVSQGSDKNKCLILMKQYDGPEHIPQIGKVNPRKLIKTSFVPFNRFQLLNSKPYKKLKENWPHINLDKLYLHLQNGKMTLRHMKNGKIVKNLIKKNQRNTKQNVKNDIIKRPTLTKKAKRYLNLLSFINSDKSKTDTQGVEDKVADMERKENGSNVNEVISQDTATPDDNNLKKEKVTEGKIDRQLIFPLDILTEARNEKLNSAIFCEKQGLFKNVSDKSIKTVTELTNIKIQFDDQEYTILCDKEKGIINTNTFEENNKNTKIDNLGVNTVGLASDAVGNEEIIKDHEDILENSNKTDLTNNTVSEPKNEKTTDSKEENNKEATENTDDNNEETQEETSESDDSETERLSTKFAGKLMIRKLHYKFRKVLNMHKEIKTDNGDLLNKELLINFFNDMPFEDKFRVAQAMAETGQKRHFPTEAAKILWKLQQKYENKYSGIFDIVYLNTEEKMLREFLERRTYNSYVKAKFKCHLCLQCFPSQHAYEYHKKWHDPSHGTFGCSLCQTWYTSKLRLHTHKQTHAVVYKCKLCTTVTHAKSVMINHWMGHIGQRVTCKICGEPYSHDSSYSDHLALHRSSHECNVCARNFASELGLSIHKRSKHPGSEEKNFPEPTKCEVCDVTYSSRAVFLKHYRCKHDPNAPKMRTIRIFRNELLTKKDRCVDANTPNQIVRKRKCNTIAITPMSEKARSKLVMTKEPQGRHASKTLAAATAAMKLARERNMMLQTGESYEETLNETRDAVSSISQELTNFEEDIGAATIFKKESVPSYDTVVRVINEKRKTKNDLTANAIMDISDEENNIRYLHQHFNAITNSSRLNHEREIELSFDNINDEVISTKVINLRPQPRKDKTSTNGNAARTISKMEHTVDAATHTITVNKRKGLDMPQLFDKVSDVNQEHAINGGNIKGGKRKPDMPQVFDTMSRDADASSSIGNRAKSRHISGKWRPNMHNVNNDDDALSSNDTRDINQESNVKVGKRRPNVQEVYDTMSLNVADSSMNVEGGKRKAIKYTPEALSINPREINDCNIKENENNTSHYDADVITIKHNTRGRNVFAVKRRPQRSMQ